MAGLLDDERARRIADFDAVFSCRDDGLAFNPALHDATARSVALDAVVRQLAAEGALTPWRDERFAVAGELGGLPLFEIERSAARYFGIATHAAHVNATTTVDGIERMWIARRSPHKAIDPGLLDNLVAGGIASGATVRSTVIKEAREEAGIPEKLASTARPASLLSILREVPDGIQRETIHVHDLLLPPGFEPRNEDGEVAGYRLATVDEVSTLIGNDEGQDIVTVDAAAVIADWLQRHGHVPADDPAAARIEAALRPPG